MSIILFTDDIAHSSTSLLKTFYQFLLITERRVLRFSTINVAGFQFFHLFFIPLISFLDLLYHFGSTSSPTLSLFFPSSPLFLFPRYCLGSSSLVIVYCPWWISFIPIASVLPLNGWLPGWLPNLCPDPYLISRSVSALGFTTGASNFILLQTLPLIRAPAAFCPILHPSSLLD